MDKSSFIGLTLLFSVGSLSANFITFEDNWGQNGYNLISSSHNGVEVVFSIERMRLVETKVDDEVVYTVTIPGCFLPNTEDHPNLPSMGRFIAIPQGAKARVTVLAQRTEILRDIDIAPAPPIPFDSDDSPMVAKKDLSIYNRDAFYPEKPVVISEPRKLRGIDCVIIGICPFQYNPIRRELIIYKDLRVRVDFVGGNGHFGEDRLRNRFWEPILENHLINYSILPQVDLMHLALSRDGYEYVIIVPDDPDHEAWADTIKAWRKLQGISTEIFRLSQIGGNDAILIEKFIDSLYNNCTTPPAAVLLLSDYQNSGYDQYGITSPIHFDFISDNKYADIDGDSLPDLVIARICSQNSSHLSNMIGKLLSYEREPCTDPNFYDHPMIACGWEDVKWFQICCEIIKGYMSKKHGKHPVHQNGICSGYPTPGCPWSTYANTYMLIDYFGSSGLAYIPDSNPYDYSYWTNSTPEGINQDFNSGAFFAQHRNHGNVTLWGQPYYNTGHMAGLFNEAYPFIISINCMTGKFDSSVWCFAETFHRIYHGALGVIAATSYSFSYVGDTWVFGLHDCMWPDFDPGYPANDLTGHQNLRTAFGFASGKYYLEASNWPGTSTYPKVWTYHVLHHHGDAFTTLYSEVPESLTVSHAPSIYQGDTIFTVTANDSSIIALTVKGEIIGVAEGTGSPFDINIEPQTAGDTMIVTVTKHNYFRYVKEVPILVGIEEEESSIGGSRIWLKQTIIRNRLILNYAVSGTKKVAVDLYDSAGRKVLTSSRNNLSGKGEIVCKTGQLSAGVYFVQIKEGTETRTTPVILVK